MLAQFKAHKEDFFAFDPDQFNEEFVAQLEASIEIAYRLDDNMIERKKAKVETAEIEVAIMNCTRAFSHLSHYVRRAYPESAQAQAQFGLEAFPEVLSSYPRFVHFMQSVEKEAAAHRDDLIEADCPPALLDSIPNLVKSLSGEDGGTGPQEDNGILRAAPENKNVRDAWKDLSDVSTAQPPSPNILGDLFRPPRSNDGGAGPQGGQRAS